MHSDLSTGEEKNKDLKYFHWLKQQWSEGQSCLDANVGMQSQKYYL